MSARQAQPRGATSQPSGLCQFAPSADLDLTSGQLAHKGGIFQQQLCGAQPDHPYAGLS